MSKFVVYLRVQPFVAQWLHHHFGDPVQFQPHSVENSTILQFTQKLPAGRQPDVAAPDLTAVCIPDNEKKDPAVYNYLGAKGKDAVVDCIERTFKLMMWSELNDMSDVGCSVLGAIDAWCECTASTSSMTALSFSDIIACAIHTLRKELTSAGKREITINDLTKNNVGNRHHDIPHFFTGQILTIKPDNTQ